LTGGGLEEFLTKKPNRTFGSQSNKFLLSSPFSPLPFLYFLDFEPKVRLDFVANILLYFSPNGNLDQPPEKGYFGDRNRALAQVISSRII
jgi:hypothetical protein